MRPLRILYVAMKYDYGLPEQGYSFEHYNFYDTLVNMGCEVLYFDTGSQLRQRGRESMNADLREVVRAEHPDLMFTVLYKDELSPHLVRDISENTDTQTLNWFTDDHWRFETFSRHWAPNFNWVVTTAPGAVERYRDIGYGHAIKSQWGCNQFVYRQLDLTPQYDITFVGMAHGNRPQLIQALRDEGLQVHVWGSGWPDGRVSHEEMVRIFNQSRINLNLSNSSVGAGPLVRAAGIALRILGAAPIAGLTRRKLASPLLALLMPERGSKRRGYIPQIKGRTFEVPGCGGFLLSGDAEGLEDFYTPDVDIVIADSFRALVRRLRCYLGDSERRAVIARSGYERTLREHTYVQRFKEIFATAGLYEAEYQG